jgi:hypothetical protein
MILCPVCLVQSVISDLLMNKVDLSLLVVSKVSSTCMLHKLCYSKQDQIEPFVNAATASKFKLCPPLILSIAEALSLCLNCGRRGVMFTVLPGIMQVMLMLRRQ